jgi:hypothetical protein
MNWIWQMLPAALVCGLVMGVSQSREFSRGIIRGLLQAAMLAGGMLVLAALVTLAENPAVLG